jgi:hypothetical protein
MPECCAICPTAESGSATSCSANFGNCGTSRLADAMSAIRKPVEIVVGPRTAGSVPVENDPLADIEAATYSASTAVP